LDGILDLSKQSNHQPETVKATGHEARIAPFPRPLLKAPESIIFVGSLCFIGCLDVHVLVTLARVP
jgi:hypothetical protein